MLESVAEAPAIEKHWPCACGECKTHEEFNDKEVAATYVYCPLFHERRDRKYMSCIPHGLDVIKEAHGDA